MAKILDGKLLASLSEENFKKRVAQLSKKTGSSPILATILVGDDPASHIYVRHKQKACENVGIVSQEHRSSLKLPVLSIVEGQL